MSNFNNIEHKLEQFGKKYYTNELIKGVILFIALGLLYLLVTLFIEFFLWLKPMQRTILFWVFIAVELFLLIRFIGFPLFKLIGLRKGISNEESSKIIGEHFPEVKDKLLNVLQLKNNSTQSDLLYASIEQKSTELNPVPFSKAINFKGNLKYLKYALIPIIIWLITFVSGKSNDLNNSLYRFVNHNVAYNPPAPFLFKLTDENLNVVQGKPLTIYVETKGEVVPQEAKIVFNDEHYFLENQGNGMFTYTFSEVKNPTEFHMEANGVESQDYQINIIKTPTIQNVSMQLFYPKHLKKASEIIKNTGNVTVPEGTTVRWNIKTHQTDSVSFINDYKKFYFNKDNSDKFHFSKQIRQNTNYQIATSNKNISEYEKLQFSIDVIKDELPQISVKSNIDSISRGAAYFAGQIADDNGISKLKIIYYDIENPQNQQQKSIKINSENVQTFFYEFPKEELKLQKGINYELFFQVFDNDAVNGYKKVASQKFSYRKKTDNEEKDEMLEEQKDYISKLEKSLKKQEKSKKDLEKIQFDLQNKKNMNWNDQKKVKNLVKRQQEYKKMMQRQTEKLQENFSEKKERTKSLQEKKEELQKRIEELKKLEKQEKLLEELEKMAEKLNKEDLVKKAKELAEQNKQQERSLERILEMTKQFYVEQKMTQLSEKLDELAKKQEQLSKKDSTKSEQEQLKKEFDEVKKQLDELKKENEKLKNPMDIPSMEELKRDTEKQMNGAKKDMEKNNKKGSKEKQKKASKNMQEMSQKMQQSMQNMSMEMEEENMEDLRYILENLLTFSFDQENLMETFSKTNATHPNFGKNLRKQQKLKKYFEHIDDSLFAVSIRSPKISTKIDEKIASVHYNIDQSLENFAETNFSNGVKNQRYVMTGVNELTDMLSNTLDAMQNPMQGKGKGKGKSFSLPDIIQKQGELMKKMKEGMKKKGKEGSKSPGEKGKPGGKQKTGKTGKPGGKGRAQKGKDGQKQGKEGKKQGKNGQNSEELDGELYKIYQQQSQLREELEKAMKEGGQQSGNAKRALQEMKRLEDQILERGFTQQTLSRMQRMNHQLLKMKNATFEQGKEDKRKSITNTKQYNRKKAKELEFKNKYFNQTEILNRQSLPLKDSYKKKVQEYFMEEKK